MSVKGRFKVHIDRSDLEDMYNNQRMSYKEIGQHYDVTSDTIKTRMKHFDIQPRAAGGSKESFTKGQETLKKKYGVTHNTQLASVKEAISRTARERTETRMVNICKDTVHNKEWLVERYVERGMSAYAVGIESGVSQMYVLKMLHEFGIEVRPNNGGETSIEAFVRRELDRHGVAYIQNDRSQPCMEGKELDFYVPDFNIAFELNGLYWHREEQVGTNAHSDKKAMGESGGINVVHIYEHQVYDKASIISSMITNFLGKSFKIHARKCEIREVDKTEVKEFFNANHLDGYAACSFAWGLYSEDELVCCASFGKPRFDNDFDLELVRFASLIGCVVVGGMSKLMSKVEGSILSYAKRDISVGRSYEACGFEFDGMTDPAYVWVKYHMVLSRYQCMKHKLGKLLGDGFNPDESETQNMTRNGWFRVFDCGNRRYIRKINKTPEE
ncbi:homing endonuclease [Vibrio phage K469]